MNRAYNAILGAALFGVIACQDLDVVNENNPDRDRALGEPSAVENVIRTAFLVWYNEFDNSDMYAIYPVLADEMTQTWIQRQVMPAREPREVVKNHPLATDEMWIQRSLWDAWNSATANTNDGLREIDEGMRILTVDPGETTPSDNTERAYAFGKFVQGLALGYVALSMDRAAPATEDTILPTDYDGLLAWEREHLAPYDEVMRVALSSLDEAIERIDASEPFTIPATWISGAENGPSYSSAELRKVVNTVAARFLVYNARTPEERTAVDWQRVLDYTAQGMDNFVFGPTWASGVLTSTFHDRLQGNTRMRADYRLVGPADVSGTYQDWLSKTIAERDRFDIVTPDRRITGPTPKSNGAYFRYRQPTDNNGFDPSRGLAYFSNYQWYRYSGRATSGQHAVLSADENMLLRAEALLRTGNLAGAADLINITRTRTRRIGSTNYDGLPAVTADGVPQADDCVPRTPTGACGSLMDALRYERQIELAGADPVRAWFDYRGFGQLLDGTPIHMPIPARYLVSLNIPFYTFGGVGGQGAATCTAGC
jgi:hypothetical protein